MKIRCMCYHRVILSLLLITNIYAMEHVSRRLQKQNNTSTSLYNYYSLHNQEFRYKLECAIVGAISAFFGTLLILEASSRLAPTTFSENASFIRNGIPIWFTMGAIGGYVVGVSSQQWRISSQNQHKKE
jgi:hypothetical protein